MSILKKIGNAVVNFLKKDLERDKQFYRKHPVRFILVYGSIFAALAVVTALNISLRWDDTIRAFNESEHAPDVTSIVLTQEEKLEEFDYICTVLNENMPSLSLFKERYGIDFNENYEKYRTAIENTKDNYEYYCTLNAIFNDIPSCHTWLYYPQYSNYGRSANQFSFMGSFNLKNYTDYWKHYLHDTAVSTTSDNYFLARYYTGNSAYFIDDAYGTPAFSDGKYTSAKIVSVDDIPADEFIAYSLSNYDLFYDTLNSKAYRDTFIFSPDISYGKKRAVKLELNDGTTEIIEAYCDPAVAVTSALGSYTREEIDNDDDGPEYFYHVDKENNITYVDIHSLYDVEQEVKELLQGIETNNIILDLRNNGGGYLNDFYECIYSPLFDESAVSTHTYYVPYSRLNEKEYFSIHPLVDIIRRKNDPIVFTEKPDLPVLNGTEKYAEYSTELKLTAGNTHDRNICVLISNGTASSADALSCDIKEYTDATVIGQKSTIGEGRGSSFIELMLPESKLSMAYYPAIAFNPDGTNNSVYGTEPDIYISYSFEDDIILNDMLRNGEDPYTYENRLKWDNALLKAIEVFETAA
ncbi:MAG: S41 family peptidase [Oscillospiraceae bacterium]|nr:S41 family peptidase [Oscillospiraceae bacterium]